MSELYESYEDLGGRTHQLTPEEEDALARLGMGSPAMLARVEARKKTLSDTAQIAINKAGAEMLRQAIINSDKAKGIDTDSTEYRLKRMQEERNRSRRS